MSNPFKAGDLVVSLLAATDLRRGGVYRVKQVDGDRVIHDDDAGHRRCRDYETYRAAIAGQDYTVSNPAGRPPQEAAGIQPSGHLPDGSSVQKHSAGGLYPCVIAWRDSKDPSRKYDAGLILPGQATPIWFKSYDAAVQVGEFWLEARA